MLTKRSVSPMKFRYMGLSCAALLVLVTSLAFAQQTAPTAPPPQKAGEKAGEPAKEAEKKTPAPPEDKVVQTKHSARIGGQEIKYTATAGGLVVENKERKREAAVL